MNKKLRIATISILLIISSTSKSWAYYDNMYTQTLSVGNDNAETVETESTQKFSYEKFPEQNVQQTTNNSQTNLEYNNQQYIPITPYYYNNNNYSVYRTIRPYYSHGTYSFGGYDYSGFSYDYGVGKRPIYITTPPMPIPPPPPPPPPNKPKPPHQHGCGGNGQHQQPPNTK